MVQKKILLYIYIYNASDKKKKKKLVKKLEKKGIKQQAQIKKNDY